MESLNACNKCKVLYNLTDRRPIALPCTDTFCEQCYAGFSEPQNPGIVKCPLDGDEFVKPPKVYYDKRIMAALEKQNPMDLIIMCEKHADLQAEFYCVKDDEYLCYKCTLLNHKEHEIKDAKDVPHTEKIQNLIDVNKLILENVAQKTVDLKNN